VAFPARPKTHGPLPGVPGRVSVLPGIPRARSTYPGVPGISIPGGWIPAGILTARFGATGTLTATANQVSTVTAPFTAAATLTAAALGKGITNAAFTGSGQLSVGIVAVGGGFAVNAPFTASGTATGIAFSQIKRAADFTATGTATAGTVAREIRNATFAGVGTLSATNFTRYAVAAPFTGAGTLTVGNVRVPVTAGFTAAGTLTATARKPYPTITATAQTTSTTTAMTSFTINLSTAEVGDTRLIILETYSTTPATPPSGWTLIGKQANSNTASLSLYRRTKVAGDPDTVAVTVNATSGASQCLTIANCGSLNIFNSSFSTSSVTPHVTPAVPNSAPGGLVIRAAAYRATVYGQSHTWGAGVTALPTVNTPSGNPDTLSVAWSIQETISEGTVVNATPAASRPYNAISVVATPPAPVPTLKLGRIIYSASPVQTATNNVPLELNTWTNDPAYPLTVSTTRGMIVQGDGPGYITLNFKRQNYWNAFTLTVKADGNAIFVFNGTATTSTLTNQISVVTDFVDGTLLTYEYWTANTAVNSGIMVVDVTNMTITPITVGFTPSGMTKDAASQAMGTTSPTQITGVVPESGSTLSTNALIANTSGTTVVRGQITLTGSYGSSYTAELRRNGTAIPGATVSGGDAMGGAPVLVIPATTITMDAGDLITMWITNPGSNCTIAAGTGTFVRLTAS